MATATKKQTTVATPTEETKFDAAWLKELCKIEITDPRWEPLHKGEHAMAALLWCVSTLPKESRRWFRTGLLIPLVRPLLQEHIEAEKAKLARKVKQAAPVVKCGTVRKTRARLRGAG